LLVVPRSEATSPANSSGEAAARALNTVVTSAPCPNQAHQPEADL
jgi:hypothetical protein